MSSLFLKQFYRLIAISIILNLTACSRSTGTNNGPVSPQLASEATSQTPTAQGTINGGGGVGVRCQDKLEVLDLYEARTSGWTLVAPPQTSAEAVALVASRIAHHFWNPETIALDKYIISLATELIEPIMEGRPFNNHATGKVEEVKFVKSLPLSHDYGNHQIPSGCRLEQIAYFSDQTTSLSIVKSSWEKLDYFSKSFLIAHEIFYMINRREGIENLLNKNAHSSEFTRRFITRLFSNYPLPAKSDSLPTDSRLTRCSTSDRDHEATFFYAFKDVSNDQTTFIFKTVLGHSSPYQLRSDFTQSSLDAALTAVGAFLPQDNPRISARLSKPVEGEATIEFLVVDSNGQRSLHEPQRFTCEKL